MSAHQPLVPLPPCPQHCRDTTKNAFTCVFTGPHPSSSHQVSPWGWGCGCSRCTVLDPEMGEAAQSWGYMLGPSPPTQSPGDECFHLRFLESFGLFGTWTVTSHLHERGGGRTWHWLWDELWLHHTPGHSQKGGVSPGLAPIGDQVLKGMGDSQWSGHWVMGFARNFWQGQEGRPSLSVERP